MPNYQSTLLGKNNSWFFLTLIISASFLLKLYSIDFSLPLYSDNMDLVMRAFAHLNGNFEMSPNRNFGWSVFLAPFLLLINSSNWIDYSILARIVGLIISLFTIILVYFIGKKFFSKEYALVCSALFAFDPHLNYVSGLAQTEPLFILTSLGAFYYIIREKNDKFTIISFVLSGISFWIRPMGLISVVIVSIIYFINFRQKSDIGKYFVYLVVFLLVISPILLIREQQYGSSFYYGDVARGFVTETSMMHAENIQSETVIGFIEKEGIATFMSEFIFEGVYNIVKGLIANSFPYLIVLLPVGIFLSIFRSGQNKKLILANWIFILASLASLIITFSIVLSPRFLYPINPFLAVFATLTISYLFNSKWGDIFTVKVKRIILFSIICSILISSVAYTSINFQKPDVVLENEKILFCKYLRNNLEGKVFNDGWALQYFSYVGYVNNEVFKTYFVDEKNILKNNFTGLERIRLTGNSVEDIIKDGEKLGLTYLVIENDQFFHKYLNDIYENESKYPYLEKIFDSENMNYQKLKIKVFKINFDLFHEINS